MYNYSGLGAVYSGLPQAVKTDIFAVITRALKQ